MSMADDRCWHCIISDLRCDSEEICENCLDRMSFQSPPRCDRGFLANELDSAFSGVIELADGVWIFQDDRRPYMGRISYSGVDYDDIVDHVLCDLDSSADQSPHPQNFRVSLCRFLDQFSSIACRWELQYEELTEYILKSAAQYQTALLLRSEPELVALRGGSTIIASALQCLVRTHHIDEISGNWSTRFFQDDDEEYVLAAELEKGTRAGGYSPSVEVWRLFAWSEVPQDRGAIGEPLPSLFRNTIQATQHVLFQRRPTDWPYIFYILCILRLSLFNLEYTNSWTDALVPAANEVGSALHDLCGLFLACTFDLHPLRSEFYIEYSELVEEDPFGKLATEHFNRMNDIWITNQPIGGVEEEELDDFWDNLENFVLGMIRL